MTDTLGSNHFSLTFYEEIPLIQEMGKLDNAVA